MNIKEAVQRKITGDANELHRRKKLWEEIVEAYGRGGANAISSILGESSDRIIGEFGVLLNQLRQNL
jgi:hypothetical protein